MKRCPQLFVALGAVGVDGVQLRGVHRIGNGLVGWLRCVPTGQVEVLRLDALLWGYGNLVEWHFIAVTLCGFYAKFIVKSQLKSSNDDGVTESVVLSNGPNRTAR